MKKFYFAFVMAAMVLLSLGTVGCKDAGKMLSKSENTDDNSAGISDKMIVEEGIKGVNKMSPMEIRPGWMLTKTFLEKDQLVYVYEIDESMFNMQDVADNYDIEAVKKDIKSSGDKNMKMFFGALVNEGKGVTYRLTGKDSGDYYDAVITVEELRELL